MSAPTKLKKLFPAKLFQVSCPEKVNSYDLAIGKRDWDHLITNIDEDSISVALFRDSCGKRSQCLQIGHAPFSPSSGEGSSGYAGNEVASLEKTEFNGNGVDGAKSLDRDILDSIQSLNSHLSDVQFATLRKLSDHDDDVAVAHETSGSAITANTASGNYSKSSTSKPTRDGDRGLKIYCTAQFLSRYDYEQNSSVLFRPVTTVPLTKVTLGTTSEAAYKWAEQKQNNFSVSLLLSVCKGKILCRKGDLFLPPSSDLFENSANRLFKDFVILDCEPVMQGHMTVNTALVITNLSKTLNVENSSTRNWIKNGTANPYDITKLLLFSDFLGSLRKPLVFTNKSTSEIEEEQLLTLTPIVDNSMQQRSVRKNDCLSFDLVLLPKHLLVRMGLFHDSLVLLSIAGVESAATGDVLKTNGNCRSRVARVNHGLNESDEDNLYLSPSMWFNLLDVPTILDPEQNSVKVNVQKFSGIDLDSDGSDDSLNTPSTSLSWSSGLPIAEEVQLALVCSPNYSASINMEKALKTFFSVERLICLDDVLAINKGPTDICDDDTLIRLEFGVVYFKVIKISPICAQCSTYVANVNCTTLYQTGVAQSYVPASMDSFFRSDPSMDYWNHCSPPGLLNYTSQLCQMIEPYLFRKSMSDHLSPSLLLIGPNGVGKTTVVMSAARRFGVHLVKVNCHELCGETSAASEAKIKMVFAKAESCTPCILLMQNIHILGKEKDGVSEDARVISTFHSLLEKAANQPEFPLIVIGTTPSIKHIDTTMSDGFLHELHVTSPVEEERLAMLVGLLNDRICGADVNLAHVAQRSAGMMLGDLTSLVTCVKRQAYQRLLGMLSIHYSVDEEEDLCLAGFCLLQADFDAALDRLQAVHSDSIGAPKIPNVTWDDVGGLAEIKSEILDTIQLPLQHPELLVAGLRRSGVCLFGPPGTGKTLLAKAVATECSLNFLSVKGPELINMYVGQSEENVREVFSRARCASPCVIFFDELDSLAPNRGRSGDSGGVMDRVVSQLLAELDGLNKSCDVFVIGATNRPDLLDPALLRPGRFDKLLYVGISEDKESQLKVLQALTRKIAMSKECNLEAVVEHCPPNMTGADFYALCSDAVLCAVKKKVTLVDQGKCSEEEKLVVEEDDFFSALSTLQPSVSLEELQSFKEIHANLKKKDQKKITPAHNS